MNNDIRNLSKWLNEGQEAPIDRQALARVLAMAEQPAQQRHFDHKAAANAALRDAQNRSYQVAKSTQPAQQQEPYGWIGENSGQFIKNVGQRIVNGTPLYTSPQPAQPSKPWVGLTPDDIRGLCANTTPSTWGISLCRLVEKFLKEKNNA